MIIRKAVVEDLPFIQSLHKKLFEYEVANFSSNLDVEYPLSEYGREYTTGLILNEIVYVVEIESKIIAYLSGTVKCANYFVLEKYAEVYNIFIEEDYRGLKIGTKLIDCFKKDCKKAGMKVIKISTQVDNIKAIKCYEKSGYKLSDMMLLCNLDE